MICTNIAKLSYSTSLIICILFTIYLTLHSSSSICLMPFYEHMWEFTYMLLVHQLWWFCNEKYRKITNKSKQRQHVFSSNMIQVHEHHLPPYTSLPDRHQTIITYNDADLLPVGQLRVNFSNINISDFPVEKGLTFCRKHFNACSAQMADILQTTFSMHVNMHWKCCLQNVSHFGQDSNLLTRLR